MAKGARGLTWCWSISCSVPPEWEVNRRSRKIVETAVNATNLTNLAVTLGAEGQSLESRMLGNGAPCRASSELPPEVAEVQGN
jgi:hypothetical protein